VRSDRSAPDLDDILTDVAVAFGVATEYWDWRGRHLAVPTKTLTSVLEALGVDTSSEQSRAAALDRRRTEPWQSMLPPYVVAWEGTQRALEVHVDHGATVNVWIVLGDGWFNRIRLRARTGTHLARSTGGGSVARVCLTDFPA
jgi:4-alpha-glucanotransferase